MTCFCVKCIKFAPLVMRGAKLIYPLQEGVAGVSASSNLTRADWVLKNYCFYPISDKSEIIFTPFSSHSFFRASRSIILLSTR